MGLDDTLPRLVATEYARLLAYKDEYKVARLYSLPSFREQLSQGFEGDYSIRLHLAPPVLGKAPVDGRPRKRAFGPWILSVLNILQKGKRFRGTKMDIFGRTEERRTEREWITRYEQDMDLVLQKLDESNVERALLLLSVPSSIRGYGIVKHEAMQKAAAIRETALLKFTSKEQTVHPRAA